MHRTFEVRGPVDNRLERGADHYAECIAHAQRCRELADTIRSHSIRQMLLDRAAGEEANAMLFRFSDSTD